MFDTWRTIVGHLLNNLTTHVLQSFDTCGAITASRQKKISLYIICNGWLQNFVNRDVVGFGRHAGEFLKVETHSECGHFVGREPL